MGGHGDGHAKPIKIPSPDIYKVENVPELVRLQEALAARGLKDPWLRNEVWRFQYPNKQAYLKILVPTLLRGALIGIPAFLVTIGIEKYLNGDDQMQ